MRGPSDSISVSQVGGTLVFRLKRRLLNRSLVLREHLSPPRVIFVLGTLQISPLGVAISHCLEEKNGLGGAEEHWIFITAFDSCWGNGHLTLHNLLLLEGVHQDVTPSELTLGSDLCVVKSCLSLEALTTTQLTGMGFYSQGNFTVLGWELLCFHPSCCRG